MAVCWVILRRQHIYTVIQAVHSLLYIVAKCHFFSVVTWKDIIKYLQKCEGCTHFCEILYIYIYIYIYSTYTHTHTHTHTHWLSVQRDWGTDFGGWCEVYHIISYIQTFTTPYTVCLNAHTEHHSLHFKRMWNLKASSQIKITITILSHQCTITLFIVSTHCSIGSAAFNAQAF